MAVYISKNNKWLESDIEYINKIENDLKIISEAAPMSLEDAVERNDVEAFHSEVFAYCTSRFEKLKI